ncbi:hypothetical protein [uncultured Roseobacter sp.]|uniref:hypothetical protein n=1 Tax=uncultured Roseobacter sp. TaxID=114847 RepID=UPI002621A6B5|nr:hypothetical protein [uncultured Roseobacter sp.]
MTNKVQEEDFGDDAHAVTIAHEVNMKITGKPQGNVAIDFIRARIQEFQGHGLENAKVVVEDLSGRIKTSPLDLNLEDIAGNFFILQHLRSGFEQPLNVCEPTIRADVVEKMREALPV